jgi:alkylated DNA repair dioxygenase AlkB
VFTKESMPPLVPGLRYVHDYLDPETHERLWTAADSQPWVRAQERGVQIYGYSYHHTHGGGIYRIGDLPPWALDVATRLWRDGLMPAVPDQMVANSYEPGAGIFAHVDLAVLGDTIVSISLGSTCVLQFTESTSGREERLLLEPRSALVLSGEARSKWTHAIPARSFDMWMNSELPRARRISLTFRTVQKT